MLTSPCALIGSDADQLVPVPSAGSLFLLLQTQPSILQAKKGRPARRMQENLKSLRFDTELKEGS